MSGAERVLPVLGSIDAAFRAGPAVPCRNGCTACCHGPFDISPADAMVIAAGVAALPPAVRDALRLRATTQVGAYRALLPGWAAPWDVGELPDVVFDRLAEALATVPCAALDAAGACQIYEFRPATCRLMGRAWFDPGHGDVLANTCPIQDQFPGYGELPAAAIGLDVIESLLDEADAEARAAGFTPTTVAGAIAQHGAT